jgi:hypothetical protein
MAGVALDSEHRSEAVLGGEKGGTAAPAAEIDERPALAIPRKPAEERPERLRVNGLVPGRLADTGRRDSAAAVEPPLLPHREAGLERRTGSYAHRSDSRLRIGAAGRAYVEIRTPSYAAGTGWRITSAIVSRKSAAISSELTSS